MELLTGTDAELLSLIASGLLVGLLTWWLWKAYVTIFQDPLSVLRKLRAQGVPGCPFVPLVGSLPKLFRSEAARDKDPALAAATLGLHIHRLNHDKHGPLYTFLLGTKPIVLCADPDTIRQVYGTHNMVMPKQDVIRKMLSVLGDGLVVSGGELWQRQRRLISPAFSMKEIKRIYPAMAECTVRCVQSLELKVKERGQLLMMEKELPQITVQVLGEAMFGMDLHGLFGRRDLPMLLEAVAEHFPKAVQTGLVHIMLPPLQFVPYPSNVRVWQTRQTMQSAIRRIVRSRLAADQEGARVESSKGSGSSGEGHTDLLQLLLDASDVSETTGSQNEAKGLSNLPKRFQEGRMPERLLVDECINFFAAGFDTTANTLTWTMCLLSQHPEWQERAREEALGLRKGDEWCPVFEELGELRTITCVLYETLRLYPIVSLLGRKVTEDTRVSEKLTLPAGCDFQVYIPALHRSKLFWGEDADDFRPDRFANGVTKAALHPGAFMPFSTGPRVCIGQNFALAEAKLILGALLCKFRWRLADDYVHHPVFFDTLRPKYGMPIMFEPLS